MFRRYRGRWSHPIADRRPPPPPLSEAALPVSVIVLVLTLLAWGLVVIYASTSIPKAIEDGQKAEKPAEGDADAGRVARVEEPATAWFI